MFHFFLHVRFFLQLANVLNVLCIGMNLDGMSLNGMILLSLNVT